MSERERRGIPVERVFVKWVALMDGAERKKGR
jgi:hypothetical protein